MGVVLNQSFKNIVTTYLGFAIGAMNVLLLYPNFMEPRYYGLVTYLLSAGTLIWPLLSYGLHNTLIKFFTFYKNKQDQERLLTLALFLPILIGLVLGLLGICFYRFILSYFSENELVQPYIWIIFIIGLSIAYFEVFFAWSKLKLKSVFGNFMREVFHRIIITVLLLLIYFKYINVEGFIYAITIVYIVRMLIMMCYAFRLMPPKIRLELPTNKWSIVKYSTLIFIAGSIATALFDLDKVMIGHYLPIENVSIYGIAIYISSVIAVPSRSMLQITGPITADYLNSNNKSALRSLYKKSSISLLVVSGLICALIISNINQIYELIPEEYQIELSIIILLSSVKVFDSLLGNNNSILFNSDYYRLVLVLGIIVSIIAIILNIVCIPLLGVLGAAIASFTAFCLYNLSKLWVVYKKLGMHPFSSKTLTVLLFISAITLLFYYIPMPINPFIGIMVKSAFLSVIYLVAVLFFNFSDDITQTLKSILKK